MQATYDSTVNGQPASVPLTRDSRPSPARPGIGGSRPKAKGTLRQRIAIAAGWTLIVLLLLLQAVTSWADWKVGARVGLYFGIVIGFLVSMIRAIGRRRELAEPDVASSSGPETLPVRAARQPRRAVSRHLTRGPGELLLDEQGNLRFAASENAKPADVRLWGIDLASASVRHVAWTIFRRLFRTSDLKRLTVADRSFMVPRHTFRVATAFDRLTTGPSLVIGFTAPDGDMKWEEFLLSTQQGRGLPQPTADPFAWADTLNAGEPDLALQRQAAAYRRRTYRLLGLALWLLSAIAVSIPLAPLAAVLSYTIGSAKAGAFAGAVAVTGSIWLGIVLCIGAVTLLCCR